MSEAASADSAVRTDVLFLLPNEDFRAFFNRVGPYLCKRPDSDPAYMTSRSLLTIALRYVWRETIHHGHCLMRCVTHRSTYGYGATSSRQARCFGPNTNDGLIRIPHSFNNLQHQANIPLEKSTLLKWIREVEWMGSGVPVSELTDEELDQRLKYGVHRVRCAYLDTTLVRLYKCLYLEVF